MRPDSLDDPRAIDALNRFARAIACVAIGGALGMIATALMVVVP
ncbi:hypothetical protein [Stakelama pacifica]|uniref:Uncharacterized protein n=1 Tax=Stakelama pacifica TaxID=517720 RepID=A0A4R6FPI8_9SPHN|nr:hypothetical protein [Stakelama pacifica]TDN83010.1 hypothetical protein EV664_105208 [Stakelama pacifica]